MEELQLWWMLVWLVLVTPVMALEMMLVRKFDDEDSNLKSKNVDGDFSTTQK